MTEENKKADPAQPDIRKNFIYRMICEAMSYAVPFLMIPYVSRALGADGIGDYSFSYSVISYFLMFGALGTAGYGTREVARVRDRRNELTGLFWGIETLSVITCTVSLAVWMAVTFLSGGHRLLFMALAPFILGTMFDISWFYTGIERMGTVALANCAVRIAWVVSTFALVHSKEDLFVYCLINSLAAFCTNLAMWVRLPKYIDGITLSFRNIGHHFRETLIYFVPTAALSVYLVLDRTLIGLITRDSYQNGYYEQAARIVNIAKTLSFVVYNSVVSARMSYLFATDATDEIRRRTDRSLNVIFFLVYGTIFGLAGIARNFVPVFLGKGYEPVEFLVYMMLPLVPIIAVSNTLGSMYYIPVGKRAQSAAYIVAGAVTNLVFNICLIPFWGARGAVAASILAELLITVLFMRNCGRFILPGQIVRWSLKRLIAGAVMAAGVWLLGMLPLNAISRLVIQVISGGVVYCGILALLKDELVCAYLQKAILRLKGNNT